MTQTERMARSDGGLIPLPGGVVLDTVMHGVWLISIRQQMRAGVGPVVYIHPERHRGGTGVTGYVEGVTTVLDALRVIHGAAHPSEAAMLWVSHLDERHCVLTSSRLRRTPPRARLLADVVGGV